MRFAPSPTGYLHVGTARTALFNWLVARHTGGVFIVRSDDTDQERSTAEYYRDVVVGLRWLGLDWDEGIEVGGPHGEYRQSRRLPRYTEAAEQLVAGGSAYPCFCSAAELEERRSTAMAEGRPPGYDGRCRTLSASEAALRRQRGEPSSLRFAVPRPAETVFSDVVRGEVRFDHDNIDDFVMLRSDGSPTYHLASSVDDVDFAITHVIRGEDLLPSTPKHILLGRALGGPAIAYAHLSLLHGPDGRKLSKRHGATALHEYRDAGFLPDAMFNYLAILGWSPGEDETLVSREEAVERFNLAAVSRNPAVFDRQKLEWMNGVYIRSLSAEEFTARSLPSVESGLQRALGEQEREAFALLAPAVQERAKLLTEVTDQVSFLFVAEPSFDEASWNKVMTGAEAPVALEGAIAALAAIEDWKVGEIEAVLRTMLEEHDLSARKGLQPLRVAVTGSSVSPPLFESMAALGKEPTLHRLEAALARLG